MNKRMNRERKVDRMSSKQRKKTGADQGEKWTRKSRTMFLKMIFSRRIYVVLSLLIQLVVLFVGFKWLGDHFFYVSGGFGVLMALVTLSIVNSQMNPSQKLSWIIPVLVAPVFGSLFYLYVRADILTKGLALGLEARHQESLPYRADDRETRQKLEKEDIQCANLAGYLKKNGGFPVYENTEAEYFPLGEDKWKRVLEELKKAEHFIFMEYFIVARGVMWDSILEILKEKAAQGVEVRVMYDGTCAINLLPFSYPEQLEAMGIQCKMFSPVKPILSTVQNNRDHRKILVIDGHTGFTGGVNFADEYINQKERFGHWKDTAVMLKGDAVQSLTLMFLEMWNLDVRGPENWEKYCKKPVSGKSIESAQTAAGKPDLGYVIPYGDSPMDRELVGKSVYLDIINTAKRYVHIMTPYLILDNELITALGYAAKRGVETIIIMPHIPDKWYAYLLARTYYEELIQAGVQIYEYTPGFVHAKIFASDDVKAVVGTINLDYRSLYLHFECAVYFYRCPVTEKVEADFQDTLTKCQKITVEDCRKLPLPKRVMGSLLRLIAPLM